SLALRDVPAGRVPGTIGSDGCCYAEPWRHTLRVTWCDDRGSRGLHASAFDSRLRVGDQELGRRRSLRRRPAGRARTAHSRDRLAARGRSARRHSHRALPRVRRHRRACARHRRTGDRWNAFGDRRERVVGSGGGPGSVTAGNEVWGRVVDVFGAPVDGGEPIAGVARSVYGTAVPLVDRPSSGAVLHTGVKAIDLLSPLERGGKAGLFGGAGV